jgi:3-deoxy-D-manno-octulosonic-acid transferase
MDDSNVLNDKRGKRILLQMRGASLLLYIIATNFYFGLLRIIAPVNKKASLYVNGRKKLLENIEAQLMNDNREKCWFHCASLGEFEQARPVMEAFKKQNPNLAIVLTFFSPSGYETRKHTPVADYVFYLPDDQAGNASRFITAINPVAAVFTKYEFWYFYINELRKRELPLVLISARFRKDQIFFKWYGNFFKRILQMFHFIFTQDENSVHLLRNYGIANSKKAGDTRFDRVIQTARTASAIDKLEAFKQHKLLLVAGSTYTAEEEILAYAMGKINAEMKILIAPHEISENRILAIEKTFKDLVTQRYSTFDAGKPSNVLIMDNIGMLAAAYKSGDIALVGGGFGTKGMHNILEPATFGVPVIYGPLNHDKFPEAKELIETGGGFKVTDKESMLHLLNDFTASADRRKSAGNLARSYIQNHQGATEVIMELSLFKKLLTKVVSNS